MEKYNIMNIVQLRLTIALMLVGLLAGISPLRAQQQQITIEEVRVVAPYVPTISDAFKINDHPRIDDTLSVNLDFKYSIFPRKVETRFEVEPIQAARMRGEPLSKLYRGHMRAGFGSYATPYLEGFYNTLRSNEYALGVHLKHFSSAGKLQDYDYSTFSDNKIGLYGKRFMGNNTLRAGLDFNRDVVHYYGFRRDDFLDHAHILEYIDGLNKKDVRQHYNLLSANVGIGSHHPDSSKFNYSTGLQYHWLTDRYDASEHNIRFSGNVGRGIPGDLLNAGVRHYFDMAALVDFYNTVSPHDTTSAAIFSLTPQIVSNTHNLRVHIGMTASVQADTASRFRAYPLAGASLSVVPGVFVVYGELAGGLQRHSMRSFSQQNPFINTAMDYGFMNVRSQISGGIRGSLTDYISYNFSANNANIDNFPLFVTDPGSLLQNQFTVVYDNIRRLTLRGEIFSQVRERFSTRIRAELHQYNLEVQERAWHLPGIELALNLKYNIQDKIILTADAFARDSTYGLVYNEMAEPVAREIHGFHVDVSAGIEYRYNRNLGVFLNFNNLQNQSLERWLHYPSQRLNILGGVSYSF